MQLIHMYTSVDSVTSAVLDFVYIPGFIYIDLVKLHVSNGNLCGNIHIEPHIYQAIIQQVSCL